jgi:hypothetical protein
MHLGWWFYFCQCNVWSLMLVTIVNPLDISFFSKTSQLRQGAVSITSFIFTQLSWKILLFLTVTIFGSNDKSGSNLKRSLFNKWIIYVNCTIILYVMKNIVIAPISKRFYQDTDNGIVSDFYLISIWYSGNDSKWQPRVVMHVL